ncbi:MAG: polysaccharide deacetylase family protein [Prevotellaceae bacterium]|jgi:peptidoglycan/xylan/chitin deacetylase (PgdA/CDA1 family)|nr:polysaccharide deacetylase family protein [Prevotellaceae bacterium]
MSNKILKTSSLLLYLQQAVFILIPFMIVYTIINHRLALLFIMLLFAAVLVWGIFDIRLSLFVPVANRLKTKENKVVLTFDDGPGNCSEKILSVLEKENVQATFFFIGKNAVNHAGIVKKVAQSGHSIGVHTQNHLFGFPFSGLKKVKREISESIVSIEKITGQKPTLFRPPFGVVNPVIAKSIRDLELTTIGWTIRSLDTKAKNGDRLLKRISGRLSAGAIILLHDIPLTSEILQDLIAEIRKKGYEFEKILPDYRKN